VSPPIHPLTSSQGAVFLINSCQRYFSCVPSYEGKALFRSYGCFFAEFLGDFSLVRLTLLELNTCVGLRYGSHDIELRDFSWKPALKNLPWRTRTFSLCLDSSLKRVPGFSRDTSLHHERKSNNAQFILDSVIPSHIVRVTEY
jgi:hypothetical protein